MSVAPTPLKPEDFARALGVSRETMQRLEIYAGLLQKWTRSINLVSRESLTDLWRRHFLDSAQLLAFLPPAPPDRPLRILDLGSGAGFPGMLLAMLGAGDVHLVESDRRKCAFLREVARTTGTPVSVRPQRIEHIEGLRADVITARALAPLDRLLDYARPLLLPAGVCLFFKGRAVEREITQLPPDPTLRMETFPSRAASDSVILRIGSLAS